MDKKQSKQPLIEKSKTSPSKKKKGAVTLDSGEESGPTPFDDATAGEYQPPDQFEDKSEEDQDAGAKAAAPALGNNSRLINFKAKLEELKVASMVDLPYTMTQCEDAMYLDSQNVITLEYHYYQDSCKYTKLRALQEHLNADGQLIGEDGITPVTNVLGTEEFQQNYRINPMSAFSRDAIINYKDEENDIIDQAKANYSKPFQEDSLQLGFTIVEGQVIEDQDQNDKPAKKGGKEKQTTTINKSEDQFLEVVVALWKVNHKGCMTRKLQAKNVKIQRRFFPSENGNMKLTRSTNKQIVSLVNFDREEKNEQFFKVYAWSPKYLEEIHVEDELTEGMNRYYIANEENFYQLVEVQFVYKGNKVLLKYIEQQPRSLEEMQESELKLEAYRVQNHIKPPAGGDKTADFEKRYKPRHAIKYVFFDCATGNVDFEYGGFRKPLFLENMNNDSVQIYEVGAIIKEIRELQYHPYMTIFFVGDFMDPAIKANQVLMKWGCASIDISMVELFQIEQQDDKIMYINSKIQNQLKEKRQKLVNYYAFDQTWIEQSKYDWEINISVTANKDFTQIGLINMPQDKAFGAPCVFIHGPRFVNYLNPIQPQSDSLMLSNPYYIHLPFDVQVNFSRNSNIKEQIFYDVIKNGEVKTMCIKVDDENQVNAVNINITASNYISERDCWMQYFQNNLNQLSYSCVYQTIHVNQGDQCAELLTKNIFLNPVNQCCNGKQSGLISRKTNQYQQLISDHPCIAYNMGDSKIILQNTLLVDERRTYILDLPEEDKFVSFVKFNQFQDIGFYHQNIRIECCSHFLFMTTPKRVRDGVQQNRLNLLFIDPYCKDVQSCLFRSSTFYDNEVFSQNDFMVRSIVQSTMVNKRDENFKTYIWTQFETTLVRSKMLRNDSEDANALLDSDAEEKQEKPIEYIDEFEAAKEFRLEPMPLLTNDKGFMYYVKMKNGKCYIFEGNPRDPKEQNHVVIFKIKAEQCLSFSIIKDNFFFMNENHVVFTLKRNDNNRYLCIDKECTFKEIQRTDFKPRLFDTTIVTEKYVIQGSKVFYLYNLAEDPFPEGIYESHDLIQNEFQSTPAFDYIKGPFMSKGSNRFFNIYRISKFKLKISLFDLPDSVQKVLINDFQNKTDMSTYVEGGKILVKVFKRFMVFTQNGEFVDEVEFNMLNYEDTEESKIDQLGILSTIVGKAAFESASGACRHREPKIKIYDFLGQNYKFKSPDPQPMVNQVNKWRLFQFSKNNKFFLFNDSISKRLFVYTLVIRKDSVEYQLVYELQISKSFLFSHMYSIRVQPIDFFYKNRSYVKVENNGTVKLSFVQNLPFVEDGVGSDEERQQGVQMIQCRLAGSIFRQDGNSFGCKVENFSQLFDFPRDINFKMMKIIETDIADLELRINQIWNKQRRHKATEFDYQEYDNLIQDLQDLTNKQSDSIYAKCFYEDLILIFSGSCLKYGRLKKNSNKQKIKGELAKKEMDIVLEKQDGQHILQDIKLQFGDKVEIVKIIETVKLNWLQIVSLDHSTGLICIITWDFENNMEQTNLQLRIEQSCDVGNHVVCGMNQKMNYLINKHQLVDTEFGIPVRQVNVDQDLDTSSVSYTKQVNLLTDFFNQRKVYQDNQQFLGIEKPSCQYAQVSQMDIQLWENIVMLGEKADLIDQTCTIRQLNLVVDGYSIFHYFSGNPDIIECLHNKYTIAKQNGQIEDEDFGFPLQIINPDNNGTTALFLAIANQSPRSFEFMVRLLSDFPEICISKMILKSYSMILAYDSEIVINFFETGGLFQPPQMQDQFFVPWDSDQTEVLFCSHTAMISPELLIQKLEENGIDVQSLLGNPDDEDPQDVSDEQSQHHISKEEKRRLIKATMRKQNLFLNFDAGQSDAAKNLKRVSVEALDMDWIFCDNNAKTLLSILADTQNEKVLTKKAIKIFINFMWKYYQIAIIKQIFFPYMLYLVQLIMLSGFTVRKYNEMFDDDKPEQEKIDQKSEFWWLSILAALETLGSAIILLYFFYLEFGQMMSSGFGYLADFWNCIDTASILLSVAFLSLFTINQVYQDAVYSAALITTIAAFGQFLMWIKIFYWMRLFPSLAYYVGLIQTTLSECLPFDLMVLIIIMAFSNFFYVLNQILEAEDNTLSFFDRHTGSDAMDSFLMVYLAGTVGNFNPLWYGQGKILKYFAITWAVLCIFIINVVFMNMLIAIMGQIYSDVSSNREENGLREQVQLIADHESLLNLQEVFQGQKYIMIMSPQVCGSDKVNEVVGMVEDSSQQIMNQLTKLNNIMNRKIDAVDQNSQHVLNNQSDVIERLQNNIKSLEKIVEDEAEKKRHENMADEDVDSPVQQAVQKKLEDQQKISLLNAVNTQYSQQQLTLENIQDLAMNWMDIADTDGNGELDFEEFSEFFQSIECITLTQEDLRRIFNEFDTSGNQYLSLEEFASALYKTFLIDQQKEQYV